MRHLARRAWPRTLARLATALLVAPLFSLFAVTSQSSAATNRVDLRVLVVANGTPGVQAIVAELTAEGVPYQEVDLTNAARAALTGAFLATGSEAHFQAVVLPNATGTTYDTSGNIIATQSLSPAELSALASFESSFHVRQVDAQQTPSAEVGMSNVITSGAPPAGTQATVTAEGKANGFGYLNGPVALSSTSYIAYGTALTSTTTPALPAGASFTTFASVPIPGSAATGVYLGDYANAGVDQLVITAALYQYFPEFQALAHGIVTWMTDGVHLGYNRYYFTTQVDDIFTPDAVWDTAHHCTPGEDCPLDANLQSIYPVVQVRMDSSDVSALVAWQQQNNYRLTLVFNGGNASIASGGTTPDDQDGGLTSALLAAKDDFIWVNHTWDHEYLGCLETLTADANDLPLVGCATDSAGQVIWVPQVTDDPSLGEQSMSVENEINKNIAWATANGLPNFDPSVLVSGDYSGLAAPPSLTDNPNFIAEVNKLGLIAVASDASRPDGNVARVLGSGPTVTTPRYPINLFYNAPNLIDEVNEYNWIYLAKDAGGNCVDTAVTTCMTTPLPDATETEAAQSFASTILPQIDAFVLQRVFSNDPRPIMVHAGNFVGPNSGGDRDIYPFLESVLNSYRSEMSANAPIVEITLREEAALLGDDAAWDASWSPSTGSGTVQAYEESGSVVVTNTGSTTLAVPLTVPSGTTVSGSPFGSTYGGEQSAWTSINGGASLTLSVPSAVPVFTSPNQLEVGTNAAFNFAVTTTGQPPAALSVAGTLPVGVSFADNGDGTGVLSGSVAQAGTWPLTFSATNAFGTTTQAFTLTVTSGPIFTSPNQLEVGTNAAFNFAVTTTGQPPAALSVAGTLPVGVSFADNGDGTGVLSGSVAQVGTWPLTFSAANAFGTTIQAFTLTVTGTAPPGGGSATPPPLIPPPLISPPPPLGPAQGGGGVTPGPAPQAQQSPWFPGAHQTRGFVGKRFSVKVVARGAPAPTVSVLKGRVPRGLSTRAVPGALIVEGKAKSAGIVTLTLNATNVAGSVHQAYKLVIDQRPQLMRHAITLVAGKPSHTRILIAGTPRPRVAISAKLPAGLTVGLDHRRNLVLTVRANERATGRFAIAITTSNRAGRSTAHLVVTVKSAPAAQR